MAPHSTVTDCQFYLKLSYFVCHGLFCILFFRKQCVKILLILIIALFGDPLHVVTEASASLTSPEPGPERNTHMGSVLWPSLAASHWSSP